MSYRLRNQNNTEIILRLNQMTWFGLLELAEAYGWNAMGTVVPEPQLEMGSSIWSEFKNLDRWNGDYWTYDGRLVLFEDALNLADALEEAFLKHNPSFQAAIYDLTPSNNHHSNKRYLPSIGAIRIMIDFCQLGAFYIEKS